MLKVKSKRTPNMANPKRAGGKIPLANRRPPAPEPEPQFKKKEEKEEEELSWRDKEKEQESLNAKCYFKYGRWWGSKKACDDKFAEAKKGRQSNGSGALHGIINHKPLKPRRQKTKNNARNGYNVIGKANLAKKRKLQSIKDKAKADVEKYSKRRREKKKRKQKLASVASGLSAFKAMRGKRPPMMPPRGFNWKKLTKVTA